MKGIENILSKSKVKAIKTFAVVTGACLAVAVVILTGKVETGTAADYKGLPREQVERLCEKEGIASSLVYATRYAGQIIDETEFIHELGEYATKADTDEEVDVQDALVDILGCNEETAEYIVQTSDKMQATEDNNIEDME